LKKIAKNKSDCVLIRIITGYPMTKAYLFKMNIVDSSSCKCGELIQSINHVF